jgi:DNA-binding transcriptional LysR family regulator
MLEALTLDQLRAFLTIAEAGSFSAAARRLSRAQSAISYTVANLEEQLQLKLFDRSDWRPRLTPEGTALLVDARAVLTKVDSLKARAKALSEGLEGELAIVVDVMFPMDALVDVLRRFQAEFPSVLLDLRIEALGGVPEMVLAGTAQLGVQATFPDVPDALEHHTLHAISLTPVAASNHPLGARRRSIHNEDLREEVQIVLSDRSRMSEGRSFAVLSSRVIRTADLGSKLAMLRAGLGWGFMPEPMVRDDVAARRLTTLRLANRPPETHALPLYLIHRRNDPPGPAGRWMMADLKRACEAAARIPRSSRARR